MKDGYVVKVFGKRKIIVGTLVSITHSSYKVDVKRFHVATWFGNCSYRKLKVSPEIRKEVCPICQHDLVEIRYFGSKPLRLSEEMESFEDYAEDGRVVFVEKAKRFDSGS